ncbi:unannotated protein [freshwater metagenome]|uniref:Unannotated protein n=1 Tax=freshwater metagenome TaxID=449393 RepID=A0A6J5Z1G5_9ZZZZ
MIQWIPEIVGAVIFLWYLSHQAGRLDRLHHRIEVSLGSLDANLARRAGVAAEIANTSALDIASASLLAQAAHNALTYHPDGLDVRMQAENELTSTIAEIFADEEDLAQFRLDQAAAVLISELIAVSKRVQLSRRFHADAVHACLNIRNQRIVRWLHLAGRAAIPQTLDFDDQLPLTLR